MTFCSSAVPHTYVLNVLCLLSPLSRVGEQTSKNGVQPGSPESKLFARQLLKSLTTVFGRTILETGFFHADPHLGNIMVLSDGRVGLIDFGQVKQISGRLRETLCKSMIALDERQDDQGSDLVGKLALELGVELKEDAQPEAAAALGIWLFDGTVKKLPGGYEGEMSLNSPVKALKSFPPDLVLVARSSILINALSHKLNVPWSLAKEWAPIARQVLETNYNSSLTMESGRDAEARVRFRDVTTAFRLWGKGRAMKAVRNLPDGALRSRVANFVLKREERRSRTKTIND